MSERPVELSSLLADVRRRWTRRALCRAATLGASAGAAVLASTLLARWLIRPDGLALVATVGLGAGLTVFALARAWWSCRKRPTDLQLARLVEERDGSLEDVLVTAVDYAARLDASRAMRDRLAADAAEALASVDLDLVVSRASLRSAARSAAGALLALAVTSAALAPSVSHATAVAFAYLFPARVIVDVVPGDAKVRDGEPFTITARLRGVDEGLAPSLHVGTGEALRTTRMTPASDPGTFSVTIDAVKASFTYSVSAAAARSRDFGVTVVRPPHVEQIDLRYEFPPALGLEPRTDEDSGDIYGPAGTRVHVSITADKPIASAALVLSDGTRVPLDGSADLRDGTLTIVDDGSYRVALVDDDGLQNPGDTEYFIRTLDDRPPDVRILRPASDRKVTALEEVRIEARADDDFGIASFDLVFQTPNGKERAIPLKGARGLSASAAHTLSMEDLGVEPGDFVTYYARARDVSRGRRSAEARSDIFFLEVKPFEEEFVAAQSQGMGGGGQQDESLQALIAAQKEIVVATWKLDARARRARDAGSQQDVKAVSRAQAELRTKVDQAGGRSQRIADPRRRRGRGGVPGDDPLGRAVEAMGRAVHELDQINTTSALPHEMDALNQLLRAEAENRRRQVTRQQAGGGGGGANRAEADLSSLFDRELRRRQETNYETPSSTEQREDAPKSDPLERVRDLARRQDALNRQQRDLASNRNQLDADELKRQLERLTREQNDLRQQAEQLAQQMQQGSPSDSQQGGQRGGQQGQQPQQARQSGQSQSQGGGQSAQEGRRLREISEDMRNAATGMRRDDAQQASDSGSRASDRLRDLERQMQAARPDDRRRAFGDLQLEARQMADEQRRLAQEAGRTASGQPGDDARRRLAGEQERLADRADRLQDQLQRMSSASGQAAAGNLQSTQEAARDLERQRIAPRMRESAASLRQSSGKDQGIGQPTDAEKSAWADADTSTASTRAARTGEEVARALDRVADRLGEASGAGDATARRLSDQLSQTQELRDRVADLERSIDALQREVDAAQQRADGQAGDGRTSPQGKPNGSERATGGTGGGGSGAGRLEQLQRDVNERMRETERLAGDLRRDNPAMQPTEQNEAWWRSFSAPGTEAFKQDFARWQSLKKHLLATLEHVESKVSDELRGRENTDRLNAGGHQSVSEEYRDLVDKYYRSLAAPRRPQ